MKFLNRKCSKCDSENIRLGGSTRKTECLPYDIAYPNDESYPDSYVLVSVSYIFYSCNSCKTRGLIKTSQSTDCCGMGKPCLPKRKPYGSS